MNFDPGGFVGLIVAILGGAAVGVERQHSGHATGPDARLGGLRTFTLLGTIAGISGYLIDTGNLVPAGFLIAGGIAVIVAGYVRASRKDIDATTEVAAVVVMGAGVLGGLGQLQLSAALTTLTVLVLAEKPRLHGLVARLDEPTMLAAARFAVMSLVILPLLPEGPYGPGPGFKPRELWVLVLLFTGMSFVGFLAQRLTGAAGYPLTGLIGGLVSSTSVTLTFARLSKSHPAQQDALATGVVAASTVLFFRVATAVAILNATLLPVLARYLWLPLAAAIVALALSWRSLRGTRAEPSKPKNPLQFRSAIEMALLFQAVLFAVFYLREWVGESGLMVGGFVLGLTDVDALTLSMTRSVGHRTTLDAAARAIAIGIVANSLMKAAIAAVMGAGRFKWLAAAALGAMAAAGAGALFI
ncbi:MAG TPA: MgtC/SapB family protein [Vicinamibacterales bacterium]|nr:MgtC/SapB family protein [Vicinamibacterales bacterium]